MTETRFSICPLCEATCGIAVEVDEDRVVSIRGDDDDPFSKGYVCPKATALADLHHDPDRVRVPMRRNGDQWHEIGWDEALAEAGERLGAVRREHGNDAVALYYGNPTIHSLDATLGIQAFVDALQSRNIFSSNSVDALPRTLVSYLMYGNQAVIPVPDLDRTEYLLILGANPVVSNGSIMTAPNAKARLKAIRARGGRVVVVDPRRSETAELADQHVFVRPGSDPLLLLSMLHVIFEEELESLDRLTVAVDGIARVRSLVGDFTPDRVSATTGVPASVITGLARDFAGAERAVAYGRLGICAHEFGALTSWLLDVLNAVTGNLDRAGGSMFTTPAVDLATLAARLGKRGSYDTFRSATAQRPEFNGELPVAALAEEMEAPGGIRALITHAGNPALSLPNGPRLERSLANLDAMVSLDCYINETTRHAHLILPPPTPLQRHEYPVVFHALSVRNVAHYAPPVFPPTANAPDEYETLLRLQYEIRSRCGAAERVKAGVLRAGARLLPPLRAVDLLMRTGAHRMSLAQLRESPHGLDLGPLEPRLKQILPASHTPLPLAPDVLARDVARARALLDAPVEDVVLIGRRSLRSNNSWMHNSKRLVKGKSRCTLRVNPEDATAWGLSEGGRASLRSRVGELMVTVEISDEVMPGVVSMPHGWGHDRKGARLSVAAEHAGQSVNDVTDDQRTDKVSGVSSLNGVPVEVVAL